MISRPVYHGYSLPLKRSLNLASFLCPLVQQIEVANLHVRAADSKYRESYNRSENLNFLLLHQKDPVGGLYSEFIYFKHSNVFTLSS